MQNDNGSLLGQKVEQPFFRYQVNNEGKKYLFLKRLVESVQDK